MGFSLTGSHPVRDAMWANKRVILFLYDEERDE